MFLDTAESPCKKTRKQRAEQFDLKGRAFGLFEHWDVCKPD